MMNTRLSAKKSKLSVELKDQESMKPLKVMKKNHLLKRSEFSLMCAIKIKKRIRRKTRKKKRKKIIEKSIRLSLI